MIFFIFGYLSAVFAYLLFLFKIETLNIQSNMVVFILLETVSFSVPIGFVGIVNVFPRISLKKLAEVDIHGK